MPPFQNAVALLARIHRRARAGVVGMSGFPRLSRTETNMCDKPLSSEYIPFAADHRRREGLGRRPFRPMGCHAQVVQFPSSAPLPELREASLAITLGFLPDGLSGRVTSP